MILPPGNIFVLLIATILLINYSRHYAKRLLIFGTLLFYVLSLPIVATSLLSALENHPPLTPSSLTQHSAQAIVILGGGRNYNPEYEQGEGVSSPTFERLRYGAYLQTKTDLPILVTGGFIDPEDTPEGVLMAKSLEEDFKVKTQWQENRSRNTAENAIYSREILEKEGIDTIFLVSKAWHLARAVEIFKEQGFTVIPAPTGFSGFASKHKSLSFYDFVPAGYAIETNARAIHELLGKAWYFIRY